MTAQSDVPRHHAVITGTGRAGTTFLVELLSSLGLDTGFNSRDLAGRKSVVAQAGLEIDVRQPGAPYIVKAPGFCDYAAQVFAQPELVIDHIVVPMRELHDAAASRRRVMGLHLAGMPWLRRLKVWFKRKELAGGLVGTRSADDQEAVLRDRLYRLMLAAADRPVKLTLLRFPRLIHDSAYLFDKLQPLLHDISFERFDRAHRQLARPDLVHRFGAERPPTPARSLLQPLEQARAGKGAGVRSSRAELGLISGSTRTARGPDAANPAGAAAARGYTSGLLPAAMAAAFAAACAGCPATAPPRVFARRHRPRCFAHPWPLFPRQPSRLT